MDAKQAFWKIQAVLTNMKPGQQIDFRAINRIIHSREDLSPREFWETADPEPQICKFFGCGARLTPEEALFGQFCHQHQPTKQDPPFFDPTNFVSL